MQTKKIVFALALAITGRHMRNTQIAAGACVLSLGVFALDIKGVQVDQPVDCNYVNSLEVRQGMTMKPCENRRPVFQTNVSFLSGTVPMMVHQSEEGVVLAVQVIRFNFQEALDALTVKYGQPKIDRSAIQNRAGSSFEQIEATWQQAGQTLHMQKHGVRIDEPVIFLSGRVFVAHEEAQRKAKAAAGAKNL